MSEQETLNIMALARVGFYNLAATRLLINELGSATAVVEHRSDLRSVVPDCSPRLAEMFSSMDDALRRAEMEMAFARQHGIQILCFGQEDYPQRLTHCDDAPLVLFYRGSVSLNARRVVCIVGTRRCTTYGQDVVRRFLTDLRTLCPDVLIVSGLAYGIDICAHRQALANGYDTVGVLAHGLDTLYPSLHRDTALQMTSHGGLLTEYFTVTKIDKANFVRRNRIVAGMSDACIVAESPRKGGALITAHLSREYGNDVFAFPGRADDKGSEGCNNLIRDNVAGLINNAEDFVKAIMWDDDAVLARQRSRGIERQIFPDLNDDETKVVDALRAINDRNINMLTISTSLPVSRLAATLFELEMKGVVRALPGGSYHLIT